MNYAVRTAAIVLAVMFSGVSACSFTSKLSLVNKTTHALTPYPVVTDPPPPHREADPGSIVPVNGKRGVPAKGFNPVYYSAGLLNPQRPNGLALQFDFESDPDPFILYRVYHYKVPPGQEGSDPGLAPTLLKEELVTITDTNHVIVVTEQVGDGQPAPTWKVEIAPAASDS